MFKKIKNKFIIGIMLLIVSIIAIQFMGSNKIDRNSYATLIEGDGSLYNTDDKIILKKQNRYLLSAGDKLETNGKTSLIIIEWGDGSITRLGGNSSLEVKESLVSDNLSSIKISFNLEKGKTWSNVVNFIGEDSYFKEYYVDMEAGVRGTIFEVNLEKDYLYVDKHEVTIEKSDGTQVVVAEKKPFDISKFSFIALEKFLKNNIDRSWQELNKSFDQIFIKNLKLALNGVKALNLKVQERLLKKLKNNLEGLSKLEKSELYNEIISSYQKLNFASPEDGDIYSQKVFYKSLLLNFSSTEDKKSLIRTSLFEFKDILKTKNTYNIKETLSLFNTNKDFIDSQDFKKYFNFDLLPDSLKAEFSKQYKFLYDMFENNLNDIKEKLKQNAVIISKTAKDTLDDIKINLINK